MGRGRGGEGEDRPPQITQTMLVKFSRVRLLSCSRVKKQNLLSKTVSSE